MKKKEEGVVVPTLHATELLRIIRARNFASQKHIVANRRWNYFLSSFFSPFIFTNNNQSLLLLLLLQGKHSDDWKNISFFVLHDQENIMRDVNHRLIVRNFLTDFRRQSSVNDYKLPSSLVCYKNI
jgi:hypothetical protein